MIPKRQTITFEEFMELNSKTDELLEYIDGVVYNQASPSTMHQTVSLNLTLVFGNHFKNRKCKVFSAPYDIILSNDENKFSNSLIPDLSVICDTDGLNEKNYVGIPTLIVEILSPFNQAHDLVTKLNIYQQYGVKEYWIVNPKLKTIRIYTLNEQRMYEEWGIYKGNEVAVSYVFKDLNVKLEDIF